MLRLIRWAGRQLRRLTVAVMVAAAGLVVLHLATRAEMDRIRDVHEVGAPIWIVDHGYHSGLIVAQSDLRRVAVEIGREDVAAGMRLRWLASRFPDADWLEIGWGDAAFYQQTPSIGDVDVLLGLRAILWPTDAVLQVVPGWSAPETAFGSSIIRADVSQQGLLGLAQRLAETIPEPVPAVGLGPSLYGQGAFYQAELDYHLFRTCNHWVAWVLRGAGLPASPVPGTFSSTLMAELRWRL